MKPGDGEIWFSNAVAVVGALILLSGCVVVGYQGLLWLQQGYWTPVELRQVGLLLNGSAAIADPTFSWQGLQKICVWVLDASLAGALILVGIGMVCLGLYMADEVRDRQ